jgi:hypothetical protein
MKRKRALLFDVLGRRSGQWPESAGPRARPQAAAIRITGGMAFALLLVAVALMAGSYYLGTLRAGSRGDAARLSRTTEVGSPPPPAPAAERPERLYAVRVFTFAVPEGRGVAAVEERVWKMADFLAAAGLPDVTPIHHPADGRGGRGEVVLYVGRSRSREELEKLVPRIRRLEYNRKAEFVDAVVVSIAP